MMKTVSIQRLKCLVCGSELENLNDDKYKCKKCEKIYDLGGISNMELTLSEFDKIFYYILDKNRLEKRFSVQ